MNKIAYTKRAFSLVESTAVMVIIGVITTILMAVLSPKDLKHDFLDKASKNLVTQIDFATRQILAKNSLDYSLTKLIALDDSVFSIISKDAEEKLTELYKKYLVGKRSGKISAYYKYVRLVDVNEKKLDISLDDFNDGFIMKNGAYFALKLHQNCYIEETQIYNPILPDKREETNSCGIIFFDANGEDDPNILGVDQFIISIGRSGIK